MKYTVNPYWTNLEVEDVTRNWVVDQDGVDRRQSCRSAAGTMVAATVNHLLARSPRVLFSMALPITDSGVSWLTPSNTATSLYDFLWNHSYRQGRSLVCRVSSMPRESSDVANITGVTCLELGVGGTFHASPAYAANMAYDQSDTNVSNYLSSLSFNEKTIDVGSVTNALAYGRITAHGGHRPLEIIVQEEEVDTLDSSMNHSYTQPSLAKPSGYVLADLAEQVRAALQEFKETRLPVVLQWSSIGGPDNPDFVSPGSIYGMTVNAAVDGTDFVNLLDHSWTASNADSPGISVFGYKSGVGLNTAVPVTFYVLGQRTDSSGDSQVRFESNWANATVDLTYNGTGTLGWVSVSGNMINTDHGYTGNKIDIYGKTDTGAITVFAVVGIVGYP